MLAYSDEFQSTLPARGATHLPLLAPPAWNISIHAPRTGSDARQPGHSGGLRYFNPRSPHGERHCAPFMDMGKSVISIHAPRTGSDADLDGHLPSGGDFNPRSPHGERRSQRLWKEYTTCNFNPRSPHGERQNFARIFLHIRYISIHAPRTGSDARFQIKTGLVLISIHAPRTGSDRAICRLRCRQAISIHAPRTGSDGISRARRCAILPFQSTLPARGATSPVRSQCSDTLFQSTLPARGATFRRFRRVLPLGFQSTLPARGATGSCIELFDAREISIHAPRTGSDDAHRLHRLLDGISIHAPRTGSDPSAKA